MTPSQILELTRKFLTRCLIRLAMKACINGVTYDHLTAALRCER